MITEFKPWYDNSYQEHFNKSLVGKEIANFRYEANLGKYGESVDRVAFDISGVRVRDVVRGTASTVDSVTDATEQLTINIEKETLIHLSRGELKQAEASNPTEAFGKEIGIKTARYLDAQIFAEVLNAAQTFDTGDLTTLTSTGVAITLSSTTVPQMNSRLAAKLRRGENQSITNMAMVVDSYAVANIEEYLLGKQFDIVNSVFKNGYTDQAFAMAKMYVSENLTGTAVLTASDVFVDTQTVVINGITFTSEATPTTAGSFDVSTAANSLGYLANLINNPGTTSATQIALSAANQALIEDYGLTAVATATTLTITAKGGGRLTLSETQTNVAWGSNMVHCYYGAKGAIDVVVQDFDEVSMIPTSDKQGMNIFSYLLGGIKTYADGARKFLDVKILST